MYSKNDYRYYLEHRLMESDDYLAHYGVKGMKWHKHKSGVKDWLKSQFSLNTPIAQNTKVVDNVQSKNKKMQSTGRDVNNILVGSIRRQNKPLNRLKRTAKMFTTREPSLEERKLNNMRKNANATANNKTAHGRIDHIAKKAAYNTELKNYADSQKPKKRKKKQTIETLNTHKRSKKEAKWNKEMQSYGKEYLASQNKKKRR